MDRSNPHIAQHHKLTLSEFFPIFPSSNPSTFSHSHVMTFITDKIIGLVHISGQPRSEESTRQLAGSLSTVTFTTHSVASVEAMQPQFGMIIVTARSAVLEMI
jgi:hypothetical protein